MSNSKGSRDHLEEYKPSKEFLFGPKLRELAKALKDKAQFSGQSRFKKNFSSKFSQRGKKEFGPANKSDRQFLGNKSL